LRGTACPQFQQINRVRGFFLPPIAIRLSFDNGWRDYTIGTRR
jgi:hypothetical protein